MSVDFFIKDLLWYRDLSRRRYELKEELLNAELIHLHRLEKKFKGLDVTADLIEHIKKIQQELLEAKCEIAQLRFSLYKYQVAEIEIVNSIVSSIANYKDEGESK